MSGKRTGKARRMGSSRKERQGLGRISHHEDLEAMEEESQAGVEKQDMGRRQVDDSPCTSLESKPSPSYDLLSTDQLHQSHSAAKIELKSAPLSVTPESRTLAFREEPVGCTFLQSQTEWPPNLQSTTCPPLNSAEQSLTTEEIVITAKITHADITQVEIPTHEDSRSTYPTTVPNICVPEDLFDSESHSMERRRKMGSPRRSSHKSDVWRRGGVEWNVADIFGENHGQEKTEKKVTETSEKMQEEKVPEVITSRIDTHYSHDEEGKEEPALVVDIHATQPSYKTERQIPSPFSEFHMQSMYTELDRHSCASLAAYESDLTGNADHLKDRMLDSDPPGGAMLLRNSQVIFCEEESGDHVNPVLQHHQPSQMCLPDEKGDAVGGFEQKKRRMTSTRKTECSLRKEKDIGAEVRDFSEEVLTDVNEILRASRGLQDIGNTEDSEEHMETDMSLIKIVNTTKSKLPSAENNDIKERKEEGPAEGNDTKEIKQEGLGEEKKSEVLKDEDPLEQNAMHESKEEDIADNETHEPKEGAALVGQNKTPELIEESLVEENDIQVLKEQGPKKHDEMQIIMGHGVEQSHQSVEKNKNILDQDVLEDEETSKAVLEMKEENKGDTEEVNVLNEEVSLKLFRGQTESTKHDQSVLGSFSVDGYQEEHKSEEKDCRSWVIHHPQGETFPASPEIKMSQNVFPKMSSQNVELTLSFDHVLCNQSANNERISTGNEPMPPTSEPPCTENFIMEDRQPSPGKRRKMGSTRKNIRRKGNEVDEDRREKATQDKGDEGGIKEEVRNEELDEHTGVEAVTELYKGEVQLDNQLIKKEEGEDAENRPKMGNKGEIIIKEDKDVSIEKTIISCAIFGPQATEHSLDVSSLASFQSKVEDSVTIKETSTNIMLEESSKILGGISDKGCSDMKKRRKMGSSRRGDREQKKWEEEDRRHIEHTDTKANSQDERGAEATVEVRENIVEAETERIEENVKLATIAVESSECGPNTIEKVEEKWEKSGEEERGSLEFCGPTFTENQKDAGVDSLNTCQVLTDNATAAGSSTSNLSVLQSSQQHQDSSLQVTSSMGKRRKMGSSRKGAKEWHKEHESERKMVLADEDRKVEKEEFPKEGYMTEVLILAKEEQLGDTRTGQRNLIEKPTLSMRSTPDTMTSQMVEHFTMPQQPELPNLQGAAPQTAVRKKLGSRRKDKDKLGTGERGLEWTKDAATTEDPDVSTVLRRIQEVLSHSTFKDKQFITLEDIQDFSSELGPCVEELQKVFQQLDRNLGGFVTPEDFSMGLREFFQSKGGPPDLIHRSEAPVGLEEMDHGPRQYFLPDLEHSGERSFQQRPAGAIGHSTPRWTSSKGTLSKEENPVPGLVCLREAGNHGQEGQAPWDRKADEASNEDTGSLSKHQESGRKQGVEQLREEPGLLSKDTEIVQQNFGEHLKEEPVTLGEGQGGLGQLRPETTAERGKHKGGQIKKDLEVEKGNVTGDRKEGTMGEKEDWKANPLKGVKGREKQCLTRGEETDKTIWEGGEEGNKKMVQDEKIEVWLVQDREGREEVIKGGRQKDEWNIVGQIRMAQTVEGTEKREETVVKVGVEREEQVMKRGKEKKEKFKVGGGEESEELVEGCEENEKDLKVKECVEREKGLKEGAGKQDKQVEQTCKETDEQIVQGGEEKEDKAVEGGDDREKQVVEECEDRKEGAAESIEESNEQVEEIARTEKFLKVKGGEDTEELIVKEEAEDEHLEEESKDRHIEERAEREKLKVEGAEEKDEQRCKEKEQHVVQGLNRKDLKVEVTEKNEGKLVEGGEKKEEQILEGGEDQEENVGAQKEQEQLEEKSTEQKQGVVERTEREGFKVQVIEEKEEKSVEEREEGEKQLAEGGEKGGKHVVNGDEKRKEQALQGSQEWKGQFVKEAEQKQEKVVEGGEERGDQVEIRIKWEELKMEGDKEREGQIMERVEREGFKVEVIEEKDEMLVEGGEDREEQVVEGNEERKGQFVEEDEVQERKVAEGGEEREGQFVEKGEVKEEKVVEGHEEREGQFVGEDEVKEEKVVAGFEERDEQVVKRIKREESKVEGGKVREEQLVERVERQGFKMEVTEEKREILVEGGEDREEQVVEGHEEREGQFVEEDEVQEEKVVAGFEERDEQVVKRIKPEESKVEGDKEREEQVVERVEREGFKMEVTEEKREILVEGGEDSEELVVEGSEEREAQFVEKGEVKQEKVVEGDEEREGQFVEEDEVQDEKVVEGFEEREGQFVEEDEVQEEKVVAGFEERDEQVVKRIKREELKVEGGKEREGQLVERVEREGFKMEVTEEKREILVEGGEGSEEQVVEGHEEREGQFVEEDEVQERKVVEGHEEREGQFVEKGEVKEEKVVEGHEEREGQFVGEDEVKEEKVVAGFEERDEQVVKRIKREESKVEGGKVREEQLVERVERQGFKMEVTEEKREILVEGGEDREEQVVEGHEEREGQFVEEDEVQEEKVVAGFEERDEQVVKRIKPEESKVEGDKEREEQVVERVEREGFKMEVTEEKREILVEGGEDSEELVVEGSEEREAQFVEKGEVKQEKVVEGDEEREGQFVEEDEVQDEKVVEGFEEREGQFVEEDKVQEEKVVAGFEERDEQVVKRIKREELKVEGGKEREGQLVERVEREGFKMEVTEEKREILVEGGEGSEEQVVEGHEEREGQFVEEDEVQERKVVEGHEEREGQFVEEDEVQERKVVEGHEEREGQFVGEDEVQEEKVVVGFEEREGQFVVGDEVQEEKVVEGGEEREGQFVEEDEVQEEKVVEGHEEREGQFVEEDEVQEEKVVEGGEEREGQFVEEDEVQEEKVVEGGEEREGQFVEEDEVQEEKVVEGGEEREGQFVEEDEVQEEKVVEGGEEREGQFVEEDEVQEEKVVEGGEERDEQVVKRIRREKLKVEGAEAKEQLVEGGEQKNEQIVQGSEEWEGKDVEGQTEHEQLEEESVKREKQVIDSAKKEELNLDGGEEREEHVHVMERRQREDLKVEGAEENEEQLVDEGEEKDEQAVEVGEEQVVEGDTENGEQVEQGRVQTKEQIEENKEREEQVGQGDEERDEQVVTKRKREEFKVDRCEQKKEQAVEGGHGEEAQVENEELFMEIGGEEREEQIVNGGEKNDEKAVKGGEEDGGQVVDANEENEEQVWQGGEERRGHFVDIIEREVFKVEGDGEKEKQLVEGGEEKDEQAVEGGEEREEQLVKRIKMKDLKVEGSKKRGDHVVQGGKKQAEQEVEGGEKEEIELGKWEERERQEGEWEDDDIVEGAENEQLLKGKGGQEKYKQVIERCKEQKEQVVQAGEEKEENVVEAQKEQQQLEEESMELEQGVLGRTERERFEVEVIEEKEAKSVEGGEESEEQVVQGGEEKEEQDQMEVALTDKAIESNIWELQRMVHLGDTLQDLRRIGRYQEDGSHLKSTNSAEDDEWIWHSELLGKQCSFSVDQEEMQSLDVWTEIGSDGLEWQAQRGAREQDGEMVGEDIFYWEDWKEESGQREITHLLTEALYPILEENETESELAENNQKANWDASQSQLKADQHKFFKSHDIEDQFVLLSSEVTGMLEDAEEKGQVQITENEKDRARGTNQEGQRKTVKAEIEQKMEKTELKDEEYSRGGEGELGKSKEQHREMGNRQKQQDQKKWEKSEGEFPKINREEDSRGAVKESEIIKVIYPEEQREDNQESRERDGKEKTSSKIEAEDWVAKMDLEEEEKKDKGIQKKELGVTLEVDKVELGKPAGEVKAQEKGQQQQPEKDRVDGTEKINKNQFNKEEKETEKERSTIEDKLEERSEEENMDLEEISQTLTKESITQPDKIWQETQQSKAEMMEDDHSEVNGKTGETNDLRTASTKESEQGHWSEENLQVEEIPLQRKMELLWDMERKVLEYVMPKEEEGMGEECGEAKEEEMHMRRRETGEEAMSIGCREAKEDEEMGISYIESEEAEEELKNPGLAEQVDWLNLPENVFTKCVSEVLDESRVKGEARGARSKLEATEVFTIDETRDQESFVFNTVVGSEGELPVCWDAENRTANEDSWKAETCEKELDLQEGVPRSEPTFKEKKWKEIEAARMEEKLEGSLSDSHVLLSKDDIENKLADNKRRNKACDTGSQVEKQVVECEDIAPVQIINVKKVDETFSSETEKDKSAEQQITRKYKMCQEGEKLEQVNRRDRKTSQEVRENEDLREAAVQLFEEIEQEIRQEFMGVREAQQSAAEEKTSRSFGATGEGSSITLHGDGQRALGCLSAGEWSPPASGPDLLYNVVLAGNSSVGKTSFMKRLQSGEMSLDHCATVGLDSCILAMMIDGQRVLLQLWDTAGQERYHSITKQILRKAQGLLLMYDITSSQSFCGIRYWMSCAEEGAPDGVVMMLLGNKNDSPEREVRRDEAERLAAEFSIPFTECSAASGDNVTHSMETLARMLKQRLDQKDEAPLMLHKEQPKKRFGCC